MAPPKILHGKHFDYEPDARGLGAFFFDASDKYTNNIAQVCSISGKTETFGSVKKRAIRVALEMRQKGITQNDVVVLCSKNTMNSTVPLLASQFLGAKTAALDPSLSVLDTTHLLGLVQPKMIFVAEEAVELIEESLKKHKFQALIVVYGNTPKYLKFSDFEASKKEEVSFRPVHVKSANDTAIILFSSGTTGLPKGICVTHFGSMYSAEAFLKIGVNTDSMMHYSSLYWISAVTMLIMSYRTGGKRVVCSAFNGDTMAKIIQDFKVTFIFMAPTYTYKLNKENTNYDTSSLKSLIVGGTPISEEQMLRTRKLLPHTLVFQGYGMTEASGFIATFDSDEDRDLIEKKPLSSGKPAPGLSIKIVNPDNEQLLGVNEKGEIRIYTKAITCGYYNQDSSGIVDSEGYLLSGDIGYYDEDKTLYVVDRIKEMFKYQSWHIVPAVLENIIMNHPAVSEVAVFGIPHELIEESLKKHKFQALIVVYGNTPKYLKFSDFETAKKEEASFRPVHAKSVYDTAIILFSSGTTGLPKGICATHFGVMSAPNGLLSFHVDPKVMVHYSSLYWISAVTILIISYSSGGKRVVCREFDGDTMAKIIQDYKVTLVFLGPRYTYKLNKENTNYDTSSLKSLILGGYGMTEATGFISTFDCDEDKDLVEMKPLSSGKPAPGLSIKIVNPDNEQLLGVNERGEIRIQTKALTSGYYNQDSSGIVDSEGYLLTGDIGYYDEGKTLYVVDRIKEMFKYQSWHIVPAVLENINMNHPDVSEVVVFGIPHDEDGNHPAAAVVIKQQYLGKIKQEDIQEFVDTQVNDRQKLRGGVYFVNEFIKTPTGKIQRRNLRDSIMQMKKQN